VTCRLLKIPLVWTIRSTWLPEFLCHGAEMTDHIRPRAAKAVADWLIARFIGFWIRYGILHGVNHAAKHFGVARFESIFECWSGDLALVAEPPEFSNVPLPERQQYIGPLIPRAEFTLPGDLEAVPGDRPLIYLAMGSSGTPRIVANVVEGFRSTPYRVIAPVQFQLDPVSGVRVPENVTVTNCLPALETNRLADLALIHGGVGTIGGRPTRFGPSLRSFGSAHRRPRRNCVTGSPGAFE